MGLNVPMITKRPLDRNSLLNSYGTHNSNLIYPAISSGNLKSLNSRSKPKQQNTVQNTPVSQSIQPQNTTQPIQQYASTAVQQSPQQKKKSAPHIMGNGTLLVKGQKISIPSDNIKIGIGWNIKDSRCELDSSAFMLGSNSKVLSDEWFIFYGQPSSPDQSVKYYLYEDNPSLTDDAELEINLSRVSSDVQKIAVSVTIYEAFKNNLNFGMVSNLYARITDSRNNTEIARFQLDECYSNVTAMIVGEIYRYKNEWKFNATGSGMSRDLAEFCGIYGVSLV